MTEPISPPTPLLRLMEARAGLEATQLLLQLPILRFMAKRGQGEPVPVDGTPDWLARLALPEES